MIREDRSYLSNTDLLAIEKGIAKLDIHSIRINGRKFIEEEMIENRKLAETLSREEWSKHCEDAERKTATIIEPIIDILDNNFIIRQYKKELSFRDSYDLFFNGDINCLSSVRMSFNKKKSSEDRENDIKKVMDYLKQFDNVEIDIAIQYTTNYNDDQVKEIVSNFVDNNETNYFFFQGMEGKIKQVYDNTYGFFKKRARNKYYEISDKDILSLTFA